MWQRHTGQECLGQPGLSAGCAPDIEGCRDAEEGRVREGFLEAAAFDLACALTLLPAQSLFPQPQERGSKCPRLWAVSSWKWLPFVQPQKGPEMEARRWRPQAGAGLLGTPWSLTLCPLLADVALDCDLNCEGRENRSFVDKVGHLGLGPERGVEFGTALGGVKKDEVITGIPCLLADAKIGGANQAWLGIFFH